MAFFFWENTPEWSSCIIFSLTKRFVASTAFPREKILHIPNLEDVGLQYSFIPSLQLQILHGSSAFRNQAIQ
jgi:hypothetical protein